MDPEIQAQAAQMWERLVAQGASQDDATRRTTEWATRRNRAAGFKREADQYAEEARNDGVEIQRPGSIRGGLSTALQGVTFGTADELGAAVRALPTLISSGRGFRETYRENLSAARQGVRATREDRPVLSAVTEVGGAIVPTALTGGAAAPTAVGRATAAAATGSRGGRFAQVLRSPIRGTAIQGTVYGAGAAEGGLKERVQGGVMGGAIGGAGGAAIMGAGRVLKPVASTAVDMVRPQLSRARGTMGRVVQALPVQTVSERAADAFARALTRSGIAPQNISKLAEQARPGETVMDVVARLGGDTNTLARMLGGAALGGTAAAAADPGESPIAGTAGVLAGAAVARRIPGNSMTRLARGAASIPSSGSERIRRFLDTRQAGSGERIARSIEQRTGHRAENVFTTLEEAKKQQAERAGPLYEQVRQHSVPLTQDLAEALSTPRFQRAYERGREIAQLEGVELPSLPDFKKLAAMGVRDVSQLEGLPDIPVMAIDYMKRGVDDMIGGALANEPELARALLQRLHRVLGEVDEAVPVYKEARSSWAGDQAVMNAMEAARRGSRAMGLRRFSLEDPRVIERAVSEMSESEREFYIRGALDDLRSQLESEGTGRNLASALTRKESPQMMRRLRSLFDDEEAFQAFVDDLGAESGMAEVRNFVLGGSPTARIQAEQADLGGMAGFRFQDLLNPRAVATRAIDTGIEGRLMGVTEATIDELAPLLTTPLDEGGMELIQQALEQLAASQQRGSTVRGLLPRTAAISAGGLAGAQSAREGP